jgi:hypothetical protein
MARTLKRLIFALYFGVCSAGNLESEERGVRYLSVVAF